MMSSTSSVVPTTDDSARVDVAVPLRPEFASIVRLIAASLGADAGFSVDDIDDLRLALSEVFGAFVEADPDDVRRSRHDRVRHVWPGLWRRRCDDVDRPAVVEAVLDDLASSIISVAVDEFEVAAGFARIVKHAADQSADQSAGQSAP